MYYTTITPPNSHQNMSSSTFDFTLVIKLVVYSAMTFATVFCSIVFICLCHLGIIEYKISHMRNNDVVIENKTEIKKTDNVSIITKMVDNVVVENECCICYETIGNKNNCTTDCGHSFCLSCIARSVRKNTGCPICRQKIFDESDEEEDDEEEDDEDEDEDDDDDDDDDDYNFYDGNSEFGTAHQVFVRSSESGSLKDIEERFLKNGITFRDLLASYLYRVDTTLDKNEDELFGQLDSVYNKICDLRDQVDTEFEEQKLFYEEDLIEKNKFEVKEVMTRICDAVEYNKNLFMGITE